MSGRSGGEGFLVLGLVTPDLLAGQVQLLADVDLLDPSRARFDDRLSESETGPGDLGARSLIRLARCDYVAHRVRHLPIMTHGCGQQP